MTVPTSLGCWWHLRILACPPQWGEASPPAPQSPPLMLRSGQFVQSFLLDMKQKNDFFFFFTSNSCFLVYTNGCGCFTCSSGDDSLRVEVSQEEAVNQGGFPKSRFPFWQTAQERKYQPSARIIMAFNTSQHLTMHSSFFISDSRWEKMTHRSI